MRTVIGLDLSLTSPGWFLRSSSGDVQHGCWSAPGRGIERMHWICRKVLTLVPSESAEPPLVVIEGFSFGSKGSALYEIGGLGYIVRYALWFRNVRCVEVTPSQVKKFAAAKGNVQKNIVIREVFKRWNVDAQDDNEADAYVLGRIGTALLGEDDLVLTAFQRDVLCELRKRNGQQS